MNALKRLSLPVFWAGALALLTAVAPGARAGAIIWNGPPITFTHNPGDGLSDHITAGVAITRGSSGGLYNSVTETSATKGISPQDTLWAFGSLSNYNALAYGPCLLEMQNNPASFIGTNFVVYLTNEDIYLSLTLTAWGGQNMNGQTSFTYMRSTAPAPTPAITITNPASGAVFAAPASLKLAASASVNGGTVTNVQFFANINSLGSDTVAPFNLTSGNLSAGSYALTAVATAAGISATSAVVNVSVVTPVTVRLSGANFNAAQFSFNYTASTGLSYVVQSSPSLQNWTSLRTNIASTSPMLFSVPATSTGMQFYRVGQLPNP